MKSKNIAAIFAVLMCIALLCTACGGDTKPEEDTDTTNTPPASETLGDKLAEDTGDEPQKNLPEDKTEDEPEGGQENVKQEDEAPEKTPETQTPQVSSGNDKTPETPAVQTPTVQMPDETAAPEFSFSDVAGREFYFSSGAGGWCTVLYIHEDGTFEGNYHDSDMGDSGEGYPNGTVYYCDFSGKFTSPKKVDDTTYVFNIDSIEYESGAGEEIIEGVKYIYVTAYGLDEAEDIYMYLPGSKIADLPEGFRSWVGYYYLEAVQETFLKFYGLYNENAETGFSSYVDETDNKAAVKSKLAEAASLGYTLKNTLLNDGSLNQAEMNVISGDLYIAWDDCLNYMWGALKKQLSEADMKKLTSEQLKWIEEKEAAVNEAGGEYDVGSIAPLARNTKAADLTRQRVYELYEYFK